MNSIVLCEGPDDLWFISYYLYKRAGWSIDKKPDIRKWGFHVVPINDHQQVNYLKKDGNGVAIWCVGGKDSFEEAVKISIQAYVMEIPSKAVNSIVIVRDRDDDDESEILRKINSWLPRIRELENKKTTEYSVKCENGENAYTHITPIIIPFQEEGAIETLLINSVKQSCDAGQVVVDHARKFVADFQKYESVCQQYLPRKRLFLKAEFSSVVAITNPDHSTGLFQNMVMACPWENSPYVKEHFEVILHAVSLPN